MFIGKGYTSIPLNSTRLVTVLVYTTIVDSPSSFNALDNRPRLTAMTFNGFFSFTNYLGITYH